MGELTSSGQGQRTPEQDWEHQDGPQQTEQRGEDADSATVPEQLSRGQPARAAAWGRPSLPACMYFSSCSRRCSTSAGVSVKIFFGGKAGTTFAPYSFLNWEESTVL